MNKSDTNIVLILIATILAIVSFSYLLDESKKKKTSFDLDKDGFDDDAKSFSKDFSNIASDMKKSERKLKNVS